MAAPMLSVRDLSIDFHTYEGTHHVLDRVNLDVEEGRTVALVGETGCGKSVTGKAIMNTLSRPPAEVVGGEIRYRGTDLLVDPAAHRRVQREEMSMVFQDPMTYLSPVFTVGEMLADVVTYRDRQDATWLDIARQALGRDAGRREEVRRQAVDLLARLQIPDPEGVLEKYPVELSGGMRQRVLIAIALINDPDFLVADEPTTALDVTVQDQILDLLAERIAERDLTVLYITHNLGVARRIADEVYVMYAGTIAESTPTEEIFEAPLHPYTRGLEASIPKLTGFEGRGIEGRIPDYTDPPAGCRFHPRCPAFMAGTCDVERPEGFRVSDDHEVACFLYEDDMGVEAAAEVAAEEVRYGDGAAAAADPDAPAADGDGPAADGGGQSADDGPVTDGGRPAADGDGADGAAGRDDVARQDDSAGQDDAAGPTGPGREVDGDGD